MSPQGLFTGLLAQPRVVVGVREVHHIGPGRDDVATTEGGRPRLEVQMKHVNTEHI